MNTQILWGDTKIMVIDHTPQRKIDTATEYVSLCTSGKLGWCYKLVKRYPMDEGRGCREKIELLKRERMNAATTKARGDVISSGLKKLRKLERGYYVYDDVTYRKLRANFDKLKRSLELLRDEGYVNWYHVKSDGYLEIGWWTDNQSIDVEVIEQGWTWFYKHDGYDSKRQMVKQMWRLYNMCAPVVDEYYPTKENRIATHMNSTGFRDTSNDVSQRVTKGSGEYDPIRLKERDKDGKYFQIVNDAKYIKQDYVKNYGTWEREVNDEPRF